MSDKRILYVNEEIAPYMPSTDLSQLGRQLPQKLHQKGYEIRTFMPKYGCINERRNQLHEVIRLSGANIIIDDNDHPLIIKVASLQPQRIQVYFIDNDDYFQKLSTDEDPRGSNRKDNDERDIFFSRGTLETAKKLRWDPSIIHCTGLVTSLTPIYLKHLYSEDPVFQNSKTVYSIVPGKDFDTLDPRILEKLAADSIPEAELQEFKELPLNGNLLHKLAIANSDGVIFHQEEANKELIEYVESKGIPYIKTSLKEVDPEIYIRFYNSLHKNEE